MSGNEKNKKWFIAMAAAVIVCFAFPVAARADTGWIEQPKILASDGAASDNFGWSVSISGDYAIVGAFYDDDAKGSAYIFKWNGTSWSQQQKLTASDGTANDQFGYSVSISGDYAIIGACYDNDKGSSSGSAYIFKWNGTNWVKQQKLTASDGAASDNFGWSVSISGDYAVVGAVGDDSEKGSAYIFLRSGTSWSQQAKLTASDGAVEDQFGISVSISGDYAIVGAFYDDDAKGSAYIFLRDGISWSQQTKLTASDGAVSDNFGISVSISGNYAIVGAFYDDSAKGSAYIFLRDGISWSQQQKLTASDGAAGDWFGGSVSISGDYAIAGAYCDNDKGFDSGSAYIFNKVCPMADLDDDCKVDFNDLAVLADEWMLEKLSYDIAPGTGDGIVNFTDWAVFANSWNGDMPQLLEFVSQWLRRSPQNADIAPAPDGDGIVNFLDFAIFADWWLYGTD